MGWDNFSQIRYVWVRSGLLVRIRLGLSKGQVSWVRLGFVGLGLADLDQVRLGRVALFRASLRGLHGVPWCIITPSTSMSLLFSAVH